MNKVVYNSCYGGFELSKKAIEELRKLKQDYEKSDWLFASGISRHDPDLIKVVELLGKEASGHCSDLKIKVITGSLYKIEEYDGLETVTTPELTSWIKIEG